MASAPAAPRPTPDWLDRAEYPFPSRWLDTPAGPLHYIDEGSGKPVVMVHGNPTWSFQFRNVIKALGGRYRAVAPDHLGFGLSAKPPEGGGFSYKPQEHARNFAALMDKLALQDVTLVVGDWGGPIGLSWALDNPGRVAGLVIANTWLWSVKDSLYYRGFSGFMGGSIGKWLIRTRNYFVNGVVPAAYGDKKKLTPAIHRHYQMPLERPEERLGAWVFPRSIIGESEWLASLWERREVLAGKRITLAWGMKDIAFREAELKRWAQAFPAAKVVRYPECGHYVSEERPDDLAREIAAVAG